jgi:pyruvate,orthophosphate dikinase
MTKWVYTFGDGHAEGSAADRNLLGGKGANLAEMCNLGLPVPPGLTITTDACVWYYDNGRKMPDGLESAVADALVNVGKIAGRAFGDPEKPLLLSVRSGARASMPGMMDTVLNLGLNDETVLAVARDSGDERFAFDSYRRFIQMYADVVMGLDHEVFEEILEDEKARLGHELDTDVSADEWREIIARYMTTIEEELGIPFPQDPHQQLWGAIGAVFASWMNARAITYRQLHDIPGFLGYRRQCPGHGVRQSRRPVRHRCGVYPQSIDRRKGTLRRVSRQRSGRGRGGRHSHPAIDHRSCTHRGGFRPAVA